VDDRSHFIRQGSLSKDLRLTAMAPKGTRRGAQMAWAETATRISETVRGFDSLGATAVPQEPIAGCEHELGAKHCRQ
jgi:hypothetical protein